MKGETAAETIRRMLNKRGRKYWEDAYAAGITIGTVSRLRKDGADIRLENLARLAATLGYEIVARRRRETK